jgi:hypothetical protein
MNFHGKGTNGYGIVLGTVTIDIAQGGRLDFCGVSFREDGEIENASASGLYQAAGKRRWATRMLMHSSTGTVFLVEGVIDIEAKSWIGAAFEWIPDDVAPPAARPEHHRGWLAYRAA